MIATEPQSQSENAWRWLCVFFFILCGSVVFLWNINQGAFLDDDNTYFYSLTYKILAPDKFEAQENELIDTMKKDGASEAMLTRLEDKKNYTYNYLLPTLLWTGAREAVFNFFPDMPYEMKVANSLYLGFILAFTFTLAASLGVLFYVRLSNTEWYVVAWVGAISALLTFLPTLKPPVLMLFNNDYWRGQIIDVLNFLHDPSVGFSFFSFTGRNNYILFIFALMAARWKNQYALFYALCSLALLFHASMGFLTLLTFIIIDAFLRPSIFKSLVILGSIFIATVYYLIVESLWQHIGFYGLIAALFIIGFIFFCGSRTAILKFFPRINAADMRLRTLAADYPLYMDLIIFCAGWLLTIPAILLIEAHIDQTQFIYFWSQLHIRILSVWQPLLLTGVLFFMMLGISKKFFILEWHRMSFLLFAVLAVLHSAYSEHRKNNLYLYPSKLTASAQELESYAIGKARYTGNCHLPEGLLWYLLARNEAYDPQSLDKYLARRPRSTRLDCHQS